MPPTYPVLLEKCINQCNSPATDPILRAALSAAQQQLATGRALPATFGLTQRQSQSPRNHSQEVAKAPGKVGQEPPSDVDAWSKG